MQKLEPEHFLPKIYKDDDNWDEDDTGAKIDVVVGGYKGSSD